MKHHIHSYYLHQHHASTFTQYRVAKLYFIWVLETKLITFMPLLLDQQDSFKRGVD